MLSADTPADALFKFLPLSKAGRRSPWPARILGAEPWSRPVRDRAKVLQEYNDGWYRQVLDLWETVSTETGGDNQAGGVLRFFYRLAKQVAAEVEANAAVYRSTSADFLLSAGDQFLTGDLALATILHYHGIVRLVDDAISGSGINTLVEPGCGTGVNLFFLLTHLSEVARVVGGDVCPNAVELGNRICRHHRLPGTFRPFDYSDPSSLAALTAGVSDYALITCHSLEQVQLRETRFVDAILSLPNPPRRVLHFEPVVWDDREVPSLMGHRYAELNHYNTDMLAVLREHAAAGRIEVEGCRKRYFGLSAFNPTSFICWRPVR